MLEQRWLLQELLLRNHSCANSLRGDNNLYTSLIISRKLLPVSLQPVLLATVIFKPLKIR